MGKCNRQSAEWRHQSVAGPRTCDVQCLVAWGEQAAGARNTTGQRALPRGSITQSYSVVGVLSQVTWRAKVSRSERISQHRGRGQHLLQACDGHIAWVDACCHGSAYAKSWAFASNSPHISHVAALCPHTFRHESIVGKKTPDGQWLSTLTAECPASLADALLAAGGHLLTTSGQGEIPLPAPADRLRLDRARPNHPLEAITSAWRAWAAAKGLISRVTETLSQPEPHAPLSPKEALTFEALGEAKPYPLAPAPGQAFRLDLVESMSKLLPFHDQELLRLLRCGCLQAPSRPCPPPTNRPRSQTPSRIPALTSPCVKATGGVPRGSATPYRPGGEAGWVVRTSHTPDSAKQAWPAGVAVGKLNVVFVEGKEPRLVLDSSICQVNTR